MKKYILPALICFAVSSISAKAAEGGKGSLPASKSSPIIHNILSNRLPARLQKSIKKEYGNYWITGLYRAELNGKTSYHITVENPDQIVTKIAALDQVKAVTPRLYASGFLSTGDESTGVRIYGIDPQSPANDPYRKGMLSGDFLTANDTQGLLIGRPAAAKLHLQVGDKVSLSVNTSNGDVQEQTFTIRGI